MNLLLMFLHHHLFLISLLSSSSLAISSTSQTPVTKKSSSDRSSSVIMNSTSTTTTTTIDDDDGDVTLLNYNTDAMTKKKRRRKKKKIRKSSRNTKKKEDENSLVDAQESQNNSIKNNNDNPVGGPIRSKSPSLPSSLPSSSRSKVLKKKSNKIIKKRKVLKQKKTPLHSQQQQDDKPKESSTHNHNDDNETILRQHIATSSYPNISTLPQSHHQRDKNRNQQRQPNTNTARQNHQIPKPSYPSNINNKKKNHNMKTKKQTTSTPSMTTSTTTTTTKWIRNYIVSLRLTKNEILFPVPRDFITDSFNLQRLSDKITDSTSTNTNLNNNNNKSKNGSSILFRSALRMILDNYNTNSPPSNNSEEDNSIIKIKEVERAAQILYGLIHARFVLSPRGLDTVRRALLMDRTQKKNKNKKKKLVPNGGGILNPIFGKCPRLNCHGNPLLPCGLNDLPSPSSTNTPSTTKPVMRYCCSCGEVFYSSSIATATASPALPATSTGTGVREEKEKDILPILDGSAWGTSFPHLLLMVYGQDLFPQIKNSSLVKKNNNNNINNNNRHAIKNELDTTMITKRDDYEERMTSYLQQQHTFSTSTSSCVVEPRIFGFRVHPNKASFTYPAQVSSLSYKRSQHNE